MTDLVATLITRPGNVAELTASVTAITDIYEPTRIADLALGEAMDLFFTSDAPLPELRERLRGLIAGAAVDVVVQPEAGRRRKLLVADMDSTIIGQECLDELAGYAGFKDKVAAITERAMRGEIEFEPALRERVAMLAGLPEETIARVIADRITLTPGATQLVRTMHAAGAKTILVSGGFTAFTDRIAAMVGFDENHANQLLAADGKLTGKVGEPILGRAAKLATLEEAIVRFGLTAKETMAVGDGANDLAMIERAGLGIAFHAKPAVAAAADARIDFGDLTALLYIQGFTRAAFVK